MKRETSKAKKWVIIAIVFIALVILAIVLFNRSNKKWERVAQVYMNDFNGDGKKQEMLQIYSPCDSDKGRPCEKTSAMKLINIETKEKIWTSNVIYSNISGNKRIAIKDGVFAIAYQGRYGSSYYEKKGVEGFSCKTGEKLWETSLGPQIRSDYFCWMIQHEKNIFVLSQNAPDTLCITSLDIMNGKKNWDVSVKSRFFNAAPIFTNNKMIVSSRNDLYAIDIHTGNVSNITNNVPYKDVFTVYDNSLLLVQETGIIKYDTSKTLIKKFPSNKKELILESDLFSVYKNRLVYFTNHDKKTQIGSIPIFTNEETKHFVFDDDMSISIIFYWLVESDESENSGFKQIKDRFIPLVFSKTEENKYINKFVIFDLDSNKIFQESKPIISPEYSFMFRDVFYHNGYYTITIFNDPIGLEQKEWVISMSAKTGKFKKAVLLSSDDGYNLPIYIWKGYEMFADNYFYGTENCTWCLSYPDLELVFSTDDELKIIDAKAEIEEIFGKMEWE